MSKIANSGRFPTAREAKKLRKKGLGVQIGTYIETVFGKPHQRQMHREDLNDAMGICVKPTNPNLTVGKRTYTMFKRAGEIDINEVVSTHMAKKKMSIGKLEQKIEELGHLANKIDASRLILKDQLYETR